MSQLKIVGIQFNVAVKVEEALDQTGIMKDVVDARASLPFGRHFDYSKEPTIEVKRVFISDKMLKSFEDPFEPMFLNNLLAVLDHYGFDADYDPKFMESFVRFYSTLPINAYRVDPVAPSNTSEGKLTRLFNGERYQRAEFIHAFCGFFEKHGFIY